VAEGRTGGVQLDDVPPLRKNGCRQGRVGAPVFRRKLAYQDATEKTGSADARGPSPSPKEVMP